MLIRSIIFAIDITGKYLYCEKKEEKSEVRPKEAVSASDEDVKRLHLKRGCDGERAFQPSKLKKRVVEEGGKDFLAF